MADSANRDPVDYASTNSSVVGAAYPQTAPIPSSQNAAAEHPTAHSHTVEDPLSNSTGAPVTAKKTSSVYRIPGSPTAMHPHRDEPNQHPNPAPAPPSKPGESNAPPCTSWATRNAVANSTTSSVGRGRESGARAESEGLPPPATQSSMHRRREVSQTPEERRLGSGSRASARTWSESRTARAKSEPATAPPFQLLSAGRPVPQLPRELEEAITAYYMSQLRQLSVADQERIVYAMEEPRDVKAVMTCLKQQDQVGNAAFGTAAVPPTGLVHATPVRSRGNGVPAHPLPKNAPQYAAKTSSRRRTLPEFHVEPHPPLPPGLTREQQTAAVRFRHRFTVEACAAFLDDALDVCLARRTRFYQEQPRIAKEEGIVLPEEQLTPLYIQSVSSLLYNMTGWTQPEAHTQSRLVVGIVHNWMPVVVAHPPAQQDSANEPQAATAPASQAKRPPVPMAPRSNAPQPVEAA